MGPAGEFSVCGITGTGLRRLTSRRPSPRRADPPVIAAAPCLPYLWPIDPRRDWQVWRLSAVFQLQFVSPRHPIRRLSAGCGTNPTGHYEAALIRHSSSSRSLSTRLSGHDAPSVTHAPGPGARLRVHCCRPSLSFTSCFILKPPGRTQRASRR